MRASWQNLCVGLILTLWIVGCVSTQLIPQSNGQLVAVGNSASESEAHKMAMERAKEHCEDNEKRFTLMGHTSKYQGMENGSNGKTRSQNDYRVEVTFECR